MPVTLVPMAWAHGSTYIIIIIQYESVVSYRSVYMYIVISLALWSPKFFQEKLSDMLAKQPLGHTVIMHGAYKLYYVTETLVAIKVPPKFGNSVVPRKNSRRQHYCNTQSLVCGILQYLGPPFV